MLVMAFKNAIIPHMDLDEVRLAVKKCGILRSALAESIGVATSTFSRFVNGKGDLKGEKLAKLIEILKKNAETLKKKAS